MIMKKYTDHIGNEFNGLKNMCDNWGVKRTTFISRIESGSSVESALTNDKYEKGCEDHTGKHFKNTSDMCKYWKISRTTFLSRMASGKTLEESLTRSPSKIRTKKVKMTQ